MKLNVNTEGWTKDKHIVLAVSTGVDSMVLLHELITRLKDSYTKLTCLHASEIYLPFVTDVMSIKYFQHIIVILYLCS